MLMIKHLSQKYVVFLRVYKMYKMGVKRLNEISLLAWSCLGFFCQGTIAPCFCSSPRVELTTWPPSTTDEQEDKPNTTLAFPLMRKIAGTYDVDQLADLTPLGSLRPITSPFPSPLCCTLQLWVVSYVDVLR